MPTITPHLWYDTEALEAAKLYTSLFPNSQITHTNTLNDTPSGDAQLIFFTLRGLSFAAVSAGPYFQFNPSISFMVHYDSAVDADATKHIDEAWAALSDGGQVLMPLDAYPFSAHYGWVADRYGLSWQLMLYDTDADQRQPVVASMLFTGDVCGKAEEASDFYLSVFSYKHESERGVLNRYGDDAPPNHEGLVAYTDFKLADRWFAAMDSSFEHGFTFNEAVSLMVSCDTQEEIDYFWGKLSAVPEAEQCGWLKDKYGVSWQIAPSILGELMGGGDAEQANRVTQAFLKMKKFDIAELQRAAAGA